MQPKSESLDAYIRELQHKISFCSYSDIEGSILCDRLVCGEQDEHLQDKLLQTLNLSLERCLEMCRMSDHKSSTLNEESTYTEDTHVDMIDRQT